MRLTNNMREAFINAAMQDVPEINYEAQIKKTILDDIVAQMPELVKQVYKKHPEYFHNSGQYFNGLGYMYAPYGNKEPTDAAIKKARELEELRAAQYKERTLLRDKLHSVTYAATTRKALLEALPEFKKYLPEEAAPLSRQVPVLANLVSDFVQAGWPKDNKGKIAKAKAALQTS